MTTRWRDEACEIIHEALAEAQALGLDGEALVRHVGAAYPCGARHEWKVWRQEMNRILKPWLKPKAEPEPRAQPLFDGIEAKETL
jgi:hypothetical protein